MDKIFKISFVVMCKIFLNKIIIYEEPNVSRMWSETDANVEDGKPSILVDDFSVRPTDWAS